MVQIALIEKDGTRGITADEVAYLANKIEEMEFYLVELEAQQVESSAMGVISMDAARSLGYQYGETSELRYFVADILDDMDNETDDGIYEFNGIEISIER